jgi:hypothetical protein
MNVARFADLRSLIPVFALLGVFAAAYPTGAVFGQTAKTHKVVIQVSSGDPADHEIALNNAVNLQQALSPDEVQIEIVAYGPGLSIMTAGSPESSRVVELAVNGVTFSACGNTLKKIQAQDGRPVQLLEGVTVVPAGVLRIMELQEQGYTYIRP